MRSRFSFLTLLAVGAAALGFLLFSNNANAKAKTAPDWSLKDVQGKEIKLSDFKGKVVILNFWATWCPPCLAEIPDFIDLQKEYRGKGVEIVGFSVDTDPPSKIAAFVKKEGINYPVVISTDELTEKYGAADGIPVTCIIGPDGTIATMRLGIADKAYLEGWVKKLLPAAPAR